jgi:hypothetical protein
MGSSVEQNGCQLSDRSSASDVEYEAACSWGKLSSTCTSRRVFVFVGCDARRTAEKGNDDFETSSAELLLVIGVYAEAAVIVGEGVWDFLLLK